MKENMDLSAPDASVFANDSTLLLMKKFFIYKLMGSDLFINHSLGLMNLSYRLLGTKLTNFAINNSVASVFTSGESVQSIMRDMRDHEKKNINGIALYVVEGLEKMDEAKMDAFYDSMMESIRL